jgi:hypothetical protein
VKRASGIEFMWEITALVVIAAAGLLWVVSRRAPERAV